tara:strand:+ start:315 stop:521 length:207 start_codon:yes stop_codon:yes gene_type:complete
MTEAFRYMDIYSMIADEIVETCTNDQGQVYYRYVENKMSLENFFINYLWGLPGWKSKAIGNVLLFWEV